MIETYIKEKISSQMTNAPLTKISTDDLPHFLKVWRYYSTGYAENALFYPAISKSTLSDKNVNEIYKLTSASGSYDVKELRLYNKAKDKIFVKQVVDFIKLSNEDKVLNIYFTCKASGVEYELAKRLFKYFKDDFGSPVLNAKLISLYYNRYNGSTPAGSGSVAITGGEVLTDKSYKQKICIYNSTALTMKEFRIYGGYDGIELINIDNLLGEAFEVPPGAYKVIVINIDIEAERAGKKLLLLQNLITNGDFSNGVTGWEIPIGATVIGGVLVYTASFQYTAPKQIVPDYTNYKAHKLYFRAKWKTNSTSNVLLLNDGTTQITIAHIGDNVMRAYSKIMTVSSIATTLFIKVQDNRASGWTETQCDEVSCIDLTATFGAGNEPTKEEMDEIINQKGWFNVETLEV